MDLRRVLLFLGYIIYLFINIYIICRLMICVDVVVVSCEGKDRRGVDFHGFVVCSMWKR